MNNVSQMLLCTALMASPVAAETVPDFREMMLESAVSAALEAGLELEQQGEASPLKLNSIIDQIPGPGSILDNGDRVFVVVSTGLTVPDILGLEAAVLEARLGDIGLEYEIASRTIPKVQAGIIVGLYPEVGDTIDATESVVFVTVTDTPHVAVPENLVGLSAPEAAKLISATGLNPIFEPTPRSPIFNRCTPNISFSYTVRTNSPASGDSILLGSDVVLSLNETSHSEGGPAKCNEHGVAY